MKNTLTLTKKQTHFLEENRQDPITGDSFEMGDKIVFCAECKSAFLKESWEYMGNQHCNQKETLQEFPLSKPLYFNSNFKFVKANESSRFTAFLLDILLILLVSSFIQLVIIAFFPFWEVKFVIYLFIFFFTLRDNLFKNRSLGKMFCSLYILDSKSNKHIFWLLASIRNLLWFFLYQIVVLIINSQQKIEMILTFIVAIVFYLLFILLFEQTPIDKILGIQVVEKKLR